jgi:hypothetical protein
VNGKDVSTDLFCVLQWQWAFDKRRYEAVRKELSGIDTVWLPLLLYEFDPENPLQESTVNAVFELYDSDSKMDDAARNLDRYPSYSARDILNVWRLRRYCEAHVQDRRCRNVGAWARRRLSHARSQNGGLDPEDGEETDMLFLWAASGPPEPTLLMTWVSARPERFPGVQVEWPLELVLEAWKAPEAGDVALRRWNMDVLFRLGRQEPTVKPPPGRNFWPEKCLATPPSEDDTELLLESRSPNILLPLCSARPELIARNLYWSETDFSQASSPPPPAVFDREQDRRLFAALSRCTGNVDFGIVRRFTALES